MPSASPEGRRPESPTRSCRSRTRFSSARAADRAGIVRVTPLVAASSDEAWAHLWLKCENLQAGGAFKLRGAFNFVSQLDPAVRARGVITYSSGNHGQAMALAARRLGAPAVVVMPTTAPAVKVDGARGVRGRGAVCRHRPRSTGRSAAEALAAERGLTIVPPFDHADIIAGQGTVGARNARAAARRDGSLRAGGRRRSHLGRRRGRQAAGAVGARRRRRACRRGEDDERSLAAGAPATLDRIDSIADGLLAVRPGDLTFQARPGAGRRGDHGDRRGDPRRHALSRTAREGGRRAERRRGGGRRDAARACRIARRARRRRQRRQPRDGALRERAARATERFSLAASSRRAARPRWPSSIVVTSPSSCRS